MLSYGETVILATTTSIRDSGLLDYLIPVFTKESGINIKTIAVGSGKAIQMGIDGEADVLLVHDKEREEKFLKDEHGVKRADVMFNDFILVGPQEGVLGNDKKNITEAMKSIYNNKIKFISRGDNSGTNSKEQSLWKKLGIVPSGTNYILAGRGMGEVLIMSNELRAYTLSDRATFLTMKENINLIIVSEKESILKNQYGVITVNPEKNKMINANGAKIFYNWIISKKSQELIGKYGIEKFGEPLFIPNVKEAM